MYFPEALGHQKVKQPLVYLLKAAAISSPMLTLSKIRERTR